MRNVKVERNQEIGQLFLDGYTANEIGRMFGISKQRVSFILHNLGIRAETEFTTVILPEPYVVVLDFGDPASATLFGLVELGFIPKPDAVVKTSPEKAHESLREFSKLEHVVAYVPTMEDDPLPGREIRSNWLVYAYPLTEARISSLPSEMLG